MPLQIRRGTNAERTSMTVPLAPGEPLYVTDDKRLYVGDGTTLGGVSITGYTDESAVDAVGNALVNGVHSNIQFIYGQTQDSANRIDSVVDLTNYSGEISADAFRGTIFADEAYVSSGSLWLGDAQITSVNTSIDLPAGTTINGVPVGSGSGVIDDETYRINIIGSVFGNDSTILIDSNTSSLRTSGLTISDNNITSINDEIYLNSNVYISEKKLNIRSLEDANQASIELETFESTGIGGFISLGSSRGTTQNRLKLENGDIAYSISFLSLGANNDAGTLGFISAIVDGVTTDTIAPGSLEFSVIDNLGNFISALDIRSTGLTRIKKGFSTNSGQDLGNTDAVDLTTVSTYFTTAGPETATLAAGTEGQIKTFAAVDVTAGDMTITVTNPAWGVLGTMIFQTNGAGCTLQYINSQWFCIGNNGVVFA